MCQAYGCTPETAWHLLGYPPMTPRRRGALTRACQDVLVLESLLDASKAAVAHGKTPPDVLSGGQLKIVAHYNRLADSCTHCGAKKGEAHGDDCPVTHSCDICGAWVGTPHVESDMATCPLVPLGIHQEDERYHAALAMMAAEAAGQE